LRVKFNLNQSNISSKTSKRIKLIFYSDLYLFYCSLFTMALYHLSKKVLRAKRYNKSIELPCLAWGGWGKKIEVFTLFLKNIKAMKKIITYTLRILLFYCTFSNVVDKKERLSILYKFRAVSKDFSFLSPI
jgi:hypothetical protein